MEVEGNVEGVGGGAKSGVNVIICLVWGGKLGKFFHGDAALIKLNGDVGLLADVKIKLLGSDVNKLI